jgi:hypothetical protein
LGWNKGGSNFILKGDNGNPKAGVGMTLPAGEIPQQERKLTKVSFAAKTHLPEVLGIKKRRRISNNDQRLTKGVSFGPQISASQVKMSDSDMGP